MKDNNKLMISEATPKDYGEVVSLFNKNQVYQFSDGLPLTVQDLDLTMKIKEVTNLFLLKENNKLIGTIGFFKFITHGCLNQDSSFSGYLLIDSENRSGQAITYLYKTILETMTHLGFANLYTEISKYNKPSLALSKLNGFTEYHGTYEDMLHYRSLRSNLPKIMNTFRISDYHGKDYDLSTFRILEELEDTQKKETRIRTTISEEEIIYKVQDNANLPYSLKLDLFQIEIVEIDGHHILQVKFLSDEVKKVRVKLGKFRFSTLTKENSSIRLKKDNKSRVQAVVVTTNGNIDVQLERTDIDVSPDNVPLSQTFQGYDLSVSSEGNLIFGKQGRKIFEDSFLLFSRPSEAHILVKEEKDKIIITLLYKGASIQKNIAIVSNEKVICSYDFNRKAQRLFPNLIKQGFKIHCQEYLIKDGENYLPYKPGSYPVEHDDFVRAEDFKNKIFNYYVPDERKKVQYTPIGKASNQMQFRPLSLLEKDDLNNLTYQFSISHVCFEKDSLGLKYNLHEDPIYKMTTNDLLKQVHNIRIEEEHNYGLKRSIANRKKYSTNNLILSCNQIVIPDRNFLADSDLHSISFDYKVQGAIEQVRSIGRMTYENKSYVLENRQSLLVYDIKQDRYLRFEAEDGIFYSYKENNKLKIRCIFTTKSSHTSNVSITEYRKSEKNEYNL